MIKAILFDFDGVLTLDATGTQSISNYISKQTGVEKELLIGEYIKYARDLLFGKTTHKEIWGKFCCGINKNIDIKILYDSFIHTPMNTKMIEIVRKVKNQGYKTGIVTDNKKDRMDIINQYFNLSNIFDVITVSAVIGSGKNNSDIFYKTIEKIKVKSNECVFIDNTKKNLIEPKRMDMKVIYFDNDKKDINQLITQLKQFDINL